MIPLKRLDALYKQRVKSTEVIPKNLEKNIYPSIRIKKLKTRREAGTKRKKEEVKNRHTDRQTRTLTGRLCNTVVHGHAGEALTHALVAVVLGVIDGAVAQVTQAVVQLPGIVTLPAAAVLVWRRP